MPPNLCSTESGGAHLRQKVLRHAGQSVHGLESSSPSAAPFVDLPQQFGDLPATVVAGDQQQPMQPMVVPRLIGPSDILVDSQLHGVGITNFQSSHDSALHRLPVISLTESCGNTYVATYR